MSGRRIHRGEIWWVSLDPTQGAETKKTRPCLVMSQDTLNRLRRTVVVVPLSSAAKAHPPITVPITCQGQSAVVIIDQIRAVAKHRLTGNYTGRQECHLESDWLLIYKVEKDRIIFERMGTHSDLFLR